MNSHLPLPSVRLRISAIRLNLRRIVICGVAAALGAFSCAAAHAVPQAAATSTSLAAFAGGSATMNVASGTVVTLTATVLAGSTPVSTGQVNFCDAAGTSCVDNYLLGSAQLTTSGVARLRLRPAPGHHTYSAVFVGTAASSTSTSATAALQVAGTQVSSTTLTQTGVAGSYILAATVAGTGSPTSPTGTLSFLDTTNSNAVLATATLAHGTSAQSFSPQVTYGTGNSPIASVTADFNNDGFQDIAMVNYRDGSVGVFLGKGDGTFAAQVTYSTGNMPSYVAAGDFNSDGFVDLAIVNSASATVSVLIGRGDGTFLNQVSYATGNMPVFVSSADLNSDGIPDLVVSNSLGGSVSVLLGKGDGTFNAQVAALSGPGTLSIAVADFNGDGIQDLAVTNFFTNTISVLIGQGSGAFNAPVTYATGSGPTPIIAADFNRDGVVDLAVANYNVNTLSIFTGRGDGTFNNQITYATGTEPYAIAPADYNGDGILDLAVANYGTNTAGIFIGRGDGTFAPQVTLSTGDGPTPISTADFNGDGIADIVTGNYHANNLSILLGQLTTTATASANGISIAGAASSSHAISATYAGDALYSASTSTTVALTAQPIVTTLTLSVSPASSTYGQQVVLNAALSPYTAQSVSTNGELVTFYNGSQSLGVAALTNGVATLNLTSLPVGANTIIASYPGDSTFIASTSSAVVLTARPIVTTLTLSVSPASSTYGQQVVLNAALSPYTVQSASTNGELVTFFNGAQSLGVAPLTNGTATLTLTSLPVGANSITASYPGDPTFVGSTSTAVVFTARPIVTALALSVSPATSIYGQQVVVSAVLSPYTAQSVSTNGELVTFFNGAQSLGAVPLINGTATLNFASLPVGANSITASYPGDPTFVASASSTAAHNVTQPTSSLTVAAQSLPFGTTSVTLTAQLTYTGIAAPAVPLSFTIDGGIAVTATCIGNAAPITCTATYFIGSLGAGTHSITVTQAANGAYAGVSATAALNLVSSDFAFTTTGTTLQTVTGGSIATFTFALNPGAIAYPGNISFAVTGLATGMTYTLTPTSVAISAGPQTVSLEVQTAKLISQAGSSPPWIRRSSLAVTLLMLPFCFFPRRRLNNRLLLLLCCGVLSASFLSGCGSTTPAPPAPVTNTITVTATAAGFATSHSASVMLTVQ